jgi:uncharacterized radical SAM superfamily Fe-S cluster-containing enzyme
MKSKTYQCLCPVCNTEHTVHAEFISASTVERDGKSYLRLSCGKHTAQELKVAFERRSGSK